jgi:hypothetical protein
MDFLARSVVTRRLPLINSGNHAGEIPSSEAMSFCFNCRSAIYLNHAGQRLRGMNRDQRPTVFVGYDSQRNVRKFSFSFGIALKPSRNKFIQVEQGSFVFIPVCNDHNLLTKAVWYEEQGNSTLSCFFYVLIMRKLRNAVVKGGTLALLALQKMIANSVFRACSYPVYGGSGGFHHHELR